MRPTAPQALPRPEEARAGGRRAPSRLARGQRARPPVRQSAARQAYPPMLAPRAPPPVCARTSHAAGSAPGPAEVTSARPRSPRPLFPGARREVTEAPPRGLRIPAKGRRDAADAGGREPGALWWQPASLPPIKLNLSEGRGLGVVEHFVLEMAE